MATTGEGERNCVTYLWRIENINSDNYKDEIEIHSPCADILERGNLCYLQLFEESQNLEIWLSFLCGKNPFLVDIEFSLLGCDDSPLVTRELKEQKGVRIRMPNPPTMEEVFVTRKSAFIPHDTLTVRCRIWKSRGSFEIARLVSACSRIEVSEDYFLLPMNNLREGEKEFKFVIFNEILNCSLDGDSLQNYNLITQLDAMNKHFELTLKVSCIDGDQEINMLCENKHLFVKSGSKQTWKVPDLNLKELLLKKIPLFGPGRNFTLVFHASAVGFDIYNSINRMVLGKSSLEHGKTIGIPGSSEASCQTDQKCCPNTSDNMSQRSDSMSALVEDFQSLYCKQNFSDFKLRSGDVSFPVHKNVLSARSPVFEAMFTSDMKESSTDSLDIPDLDCHTLNRMLTFLYTGTLEPDLEWESAAKVYYAADKYQVQTLKQECSSILKSAISVSNVSDMLTLAHNHEDEDLTSFVHDFILSRFDEVMHSAEWEKFMDTNAQLAGKSTLYLCRKGKFIHH